jgi:hypothetical protein
MNTKISSVILAVLFLVAGVRGVHALEDRGWPKEKTIDGNRLVAHQPQVDKWKDYSKLEARMAVELTPRGQKKPIIGALWLEADTDVDLDNRTVALSNLHIVKANFPALNKSTVEKIQKRLSELLPQSVTGVDLDRILQNIERTEEIARTLKGSDVPPKIFVSTAPAILVQFDGDPAFCPIPDTTLAFAVNTNWDFFSDSAGKAYYLLNEDTWLTTKDYLKGPWSVASALPADFSRLPNDENWKSVRDHLNGNAKLDGGIPKVFVSTTPAELIVINGNPELASIEGTRLSYVSNTDADLIFSLEDNSFYFLVSGRWFRASDLMGSWEPAGKLPEDFARIPEDGPRGDVLASVPGTVAAQEALIYAQIPRKAVVKRSEAKLEVAYDGEPQFVPIKGTSLRYAANTASDVISVNGKYYACQDGVWFVSGSPTGPWVVADSVPKEIYQIPADSPVYPVTYVQVYDSSDSEVEFGYTSGYLDMYEAEGALVYGTGYLYPPYLRWLGPRPIYFPRPYSYGFRAYYNPVTGAFARGGVVYGPYRGIGRGAVYNPSTGTYARGTAVWGPHGSAWAGVVYTPSSGWHVVHGSTFRPEVSPYARWGKAAAAVGSAGILRSAAARGGSLTPRGSTAAQQARQTLRESPEAQAARDRVAAKDKVSGDFARKGSGDLYVGKDGNVYRRTDEGWAKYDANRKWDPVAVDRTRDAARDAASAEDRRDFEQARAKQQALRDEQLRKEKERQEQLDAQRRSAENLQRREIEQQRVRTERLQDQLLERQRLQRQQLEAAKRAQSFQSNEHAVRSLQQEAASRSRGNYRAQNFQSFQRSAPYRGDAPRGRR